MPVSMETALLTLCLFPLWATLLWILWRGSIGPRLIPRGEIIAAMEELYDRHGEQAFEIACAREHRAWRDDDFFEQGRWRRIRNEIMRREGERGVGFSRIG